MDFRFSPQALAFEQEIKTFLEQHWGPEMRLAAIDHNDGYDAERAFRKKLAGRGWLTMSWPEEWGGKRRPFEEQYLFQEALNYEIGRAHV